MESRPEMSRKMKNLLLIVKITSECRAVQKDCSLVEVWKTC